MADPKDLPRPVVSPDGTRYWDGSDWRLLPGPNSEWDGAQWLAKPEGVESKWTGQVWAVRPTPQAQWSGTQWLVPPEGVESRWDGNTWSVQVDPDSRWSGTQWLSPPPNVRSAWNGRSWVAAPNEDAEWNGSIWVAPTRTQSEPAGTQTGRAKLLVALGLLALLAIAVVGLFVGIRGYQSFEAGSGATEPATEPLTAEEQALLDRWDASGANFAFRVVPPRDRIDFLLASCTYLERDSVGRSELLSWMSKAQTTWSREFRLQLPNPAWSAFEQWLNVGMSDWCGIEANRFTIVMDNGSPGILDDVTVTPLRKGTVELSWPEAAGQEYVSVPIYYQYRVGAGDYSTTSSTSAVIEGLESGTQWRGEVRVVYGPPEAGGAVGRPFEVRVEAP